MLDSALLKQFCEQFFGYGDLSAPIWFVGMEEGGGGTEIEVAARLSTFETQHAATQRPNPVADLAEFHLGFGDYARFTPGANVQTTWKELMRVMLLLLDRIPANAPPAAVLELLRDYQINEFGRIGGGAALLELMPLPKPGLNSWPYAAWTDAEELPYLQNQLAYRMTVMPKRIAAISHLIKEHEPRAVLFYGLGYEPQWAQIAGAPFIGEACPRTVSNGTTLFLSMPHPASHGNVREVYERAAAIIKSLDLFAPDAAAHQGAGMAVLV